MKYERSHNQAFYSVYYYSVDIWVIKERPFLHQMCCHIKENGNLVGCHLVELLHFTYMKNFSQRGSRVWCVVLEETKSTTCVTRIAILTL